MELEANFRVNTVDQSRYHYLMVIIVWRLCTHRTSSLAAGMTNSGFKEVIAQNVGIGDFYADNAFGYFLDLSQKRMVSSI